MTYSITKEEISAQPVLVGRRRVTRSEIAAAIGEILPRIFHHAQQQGLPLTGQPFARYSEVSSGLMTIEPGMRVAVPEEEHRRAGSDPGGEDDDIRADLLPGGPVAKTIHSGPYETLHEAYAALEAWMEGEGLTPAGSPWETYVTDPTTIPDPKGWKTEVCWPVA